MRWNRRDWIMLLAVTVLAAVLRFYQLGKVPPGFQFDEAFNAIDAEQIWFGNRPLFLPANGGREVFYSYFQALIGTFLGFNIYSLRLASALLGILAVPLAYWLVRRLLQRNSRAIAAFTSLTLATSFWHLHFSHYGIRVITMPVLLAGLFGFYWLGMQGGNSRTRWGALLMSGALTGLSVWTHPSGRFTPFVLIGYSAWLWWRYPGRRRLTVDNPFVGLALAGLMAFLVFLPLGLEFYRHPAFFVGHASEVSIFAQRVSGDTPWWTLGANILHVLGMFSIAGDREWAHNLAGRPVFDPLISIPFTLGVLLWGVRLWRRRRDDPDVDALALLALWTAVMLLPSVLSEAAPNYSRTLPALPAVFVAAGLGLSWLTEVRLLEKAGFLNALPRLRLGHLLAGFLLLVSAVWSGYDYFVRLPRQPEAYYIYDQDKVDALNHLEALAADATVYLAPLWGDHATFTFLRDWRKIKSLDTSETLVLPPVGQGAVYAFPSEKQREAEGVAQQWPGVAVTHFADALGKPLLAEVQVAANLLTAWPLAYQPVEPVEIRFDDAPTLLGLQPLDNGHELALFWRSEAPTLRDLTVFIHLIDGDGRRIGQIDKLPGNGSYLTPRWSPGERVIERYRPEPTDPCSSGDTVQVVVGWYELAAGGARRPRLDGAGDSTMAGSLKLPMVAYPLDQMPDMQQVDQQVGVGLRLLAYTVHSGEPAADTSLTVDLYWQAHQAVTQEPLTLHLTGNNHSTALWQGLIAPGLQWAEQEFVCRRLHLRLPSALASGEYQLAITTKMTSTALHKLTIK